MAYLVFPAGSFLTKFPLSKNFEHAQIMVHMDMGDKDHLEALQVLIYLAKPEIVD